MASTRKTTKTTKKKPRVTTAEFDGFKGRRYAHHPLAGDQAWLVIKKHAPHLSEYECHQVIEDWLKNGVIYEEDYYDTKYRRVRKGIFVNEEKRPGREIKTPE